MALNIKAIQLFGALPALQNLSTEKLKISLSYQLYKIREAIDKEVAILSKLRTDILQKHNYKNGDSLDENEELKKEFNEFLEQSVELNVDKIKLVELGDINISVNDLAHIDFLIEK